MKLRRGRFSTKFINLRQILLLELTHTQTFSNQVPVLHGAFRCGDLHFLSLSVYNHFTSTTVGGFLLSKHLVKKFAVVLSRWSSRN